MQKTITLSKEVYYKFINHGFVLEENALMGELLQGVESEELYLDANAYVRHIFPQNVTVAYKCSLAVKPNPSVILCGEDGKIGEVEKIIHQNEARIISASQRKFVMG